MRVLVTGANGFVGKYLVKVLQDKGHHVYVGTRTSYRDLFLGTDVRHVSIDLMDPFLLCNLIEEIKPDGIIHLAAQSMVKIAWERPTYTLMVNVIGTVNVINAVKSVSRRTKIITVGSGEEYGLVAKCGQPLREEALCSPQNPYATSKLAMGQVAIQLAKKEGLNIIHVRPFNHFGPGQQKGYVVSDFASQIAKIEQGMCPPTVKVGDLSTKRDFTDVRDVVNAYLSLLENDVEPGIYNVCSGTVHEIHEIIDFLVHKAYVPIELQIDEELFRPSEVPIFVGSSSKIYNATGWKPVSNFYDSLLDTLQWWRNDGII